MGYHIIRLQDDHLHVKSSALEIDSLLCYQNPLPEALYKLIMTKPLNLVWIEHPIENDPMLQQLREDGIAVITGKRLYEEVIKKQRGD